MVFTPSQIATDLGVDAIRLEFFHCLLIFAYENSKWTQVECIDFAKYVAWKLPPDEWRYIWTSHIFTKPFTTNPLKNETGNRYSNWANFDGAFTSDKP